MGTHSRHRQPVFEGRSVRGEREIADRSAIRCQHILIEKPDAAAYGSLSVAGRIPGKAQSGERGSVSADARGRLVRVSMNLAPGLPRIDCHFVRSRVHSAVP